jgi:hypothetical protein
MPIIVKRSDSSLTNKFAVSDELERLHEFVNTHEKIYIYGAGEVGRGIAHYLKQCDVIVTGYVTSDVIEAFGEIYVAGKHGMILGVGEQLIQEVATKAAKTFTASDTFCLSAERRHSMGKFMSLDYIKSHLNITVDIVNICNQNCASCYDFAPVARPDFYAHQEYIGDLGRLHALLPNFSGFLIFSCGEPLLHPDLFAFFATARDFFPNAKIKCASNGLLLHTLTRKQNLSLKELQVIMSVTEYPINDSGRVSFYAAADEIGVDYEIITSGKNKNFGKHVLKLDKSVPAWDFFNCVRYSMLSSIIMSKGRLYNCGVTAHARYFNEAIGTNLELREGADYLNLYDTDAEKIFEFKRTRMPFCSYCDNKNSKIIPWSRSKRKIDEWI